jgi:putative ubiquitin-RnfH superfamily antitoxin RatB of RatAB toxin-antitoxin module
VSTAQSGGTGCKRCTVAFATRERQFLFRVELPADARIAEALAAARALAASAELAAEIPWDSASVGIFGELRSRSDGFADGDRIELYRPLERDPRERRRERVQRERGSGTQRDKPMRRSGSPKR